MISVEEIYKSFDGFEVLRGVTVEIRKGEILALIGRSGYGKSVLIKHAAGLMQPDRGHVFVEGNDMCCLRGKKLQELRSRLGFLFQNGALFDSLTVYENVAFPLKETTNLSDQEIRERVLYELDQVGLTGAEQKYPAQISGGMVKRTALARALVKNPEIMLFDEPTTGLDPIIGNTILNVISTCHQRLKSTGIIVTHEIQEICRIVQNMAMMHEGKILINGSPEEIFSSKNPVVQQFITGSIDGPIQYH